ncbi:MAG: hypothetical protein WBA01_19265 [Phormidesmis sp.]
MTQNDTSLNDTTEAIENSWYIVKQASNQCEILSEAALEAHADSIKSDSSESDSGESDSGESDSIETNEPEVIKWGPFKTQNQAIAKRIGLIRAGKCQPS